MAEFLAFFLEVERGMKGTQIAEQGPEDPCSFFIYNLTKLLELFPILIRINIKKAVLGKSISSLDKSQ